MSEGQQLVRVRLSKENILEFSGRRLASVVALNHDDRVRRQFSVYSHGLRYVAERIDSPDTIDVRFWGQICDDSQGIYDFFGNEPLANYLYGTMRLNVPGLLIVHQPG